MSRKAAPATQRVIAYIDGFNLYFGLKSKGWKRYYWLDISALSRHLLEKGQTLAGVKYFTSRISAPPEKRKRQATYIEALETVAGLLIYYGSYQDHSIECRKCGNVFSKPNEKMTDVNIATELLTDGFRDQFDTALLISADSDLAGPIVKLRALFPKKRVIVAFPPDRFSYHLSRLAHGHFTIGRKKLAESLFPDKVRKKDGYVLKRPERWEGTGETPAAPAVGEKKRVRKRPGTESGRRKTPLVKTSLKSGTRRKTKAQPKAPAKRR